MSIDTRFFSKKLLAQSGKYWVQWLLFAVSKYMKQTPTMEELNQ